MALSDKQIEQVLTQLEAAEPLDVLLSRFSEEDQAEIETILDVKDFMEAQSLSIQPGAAGFKHVLSQSIIFEDDEQAGGWGQWMKYFRWAAPATLSFALLLYAFNPLSIEEDQSSIVFPADVETITQESENLFDEPPMDKTMASRASSSAMVVSDMVSMSEREAMSFAESDSMEVVTENVEDLVRRLGAEFDAELVEYETLKNDLSPYYEENLFSMNKISNLSL